MRAPDIRHAAAMAEAIAGDYYGCRLDLSARDAAPQGKRSPTPGTECVIRLRDAGASDRAVRLFLTFVAAMDRFRDAERLWKSGLRLHQSHPELFEPAEVAAMPLPTLRERLSECGVSQRHRPDSSAWHTIARSLAAGGNPVSRVVDTGVGNARELIDYLDAARHEFPMLRGPNVRAFWIRMLVSPGRAAIDDMDYIPVGVDVHTRRVTNNLGILDTEHMPEGRAREAIQNVWREAIAEAKIEKRPEITDTSAALDQALWTFGRLGCSYCHTAPRPVPIGRACDHCRLRNLR